MSQEEMDFVHTGPGTIAGRYLRKFWQPVCVGGDLKPGQALPVRLMSENFTLYRGESGTPYVVAFRCAHRGAQLSTGWVEGDDIRCRYHGWKYDGCGRCIEQPGEEESFTAKVGIKSYPAREHLGLIFVYLGEGEPPPLRRFPEFEKPGLISVGPPEVWPCNYFNRIDNACDVGHVTFTHRESLQRRAGSPKYFTVPTLAAEETEYGIRTAVVRTEGPTDYFHFHMPNINQAPPSGRVETGAQNAANLRAHRLFWRVPIDDEHCVSYVVSWLPLTGDAARDFEARRVDLRSSMAASPNETAAAILKGKMRLKDVDKDASPYYFFWIEDYVVQVGQGTIADRSDERLGRIDVGPILLRKIWQRELRALAEGRGLKQWKSPEKPLVETER
ncbi:MAG TPA: aromatic ring-hydroxylating dioxygenase subunit alpha [Candidatus Binatia bacterium]|jgi:5,5'-dehydrodivanillate O-demethylase